MHQGDDPDGITQRLYAYHYEESTENVVDEEKTASDGSGKNCYPSDHVSIL